LGWHSVASATNATALGQKATASAVLSTAIGDNAQAIAANSVALGANSIANRPNTVSVGSPGAERIIANVAPGILPTDAVNVSQLQGVFSTLSSAIQNVQQEERRGIAAVTAAAFAPTPTRPGGTTFAVNGSTFEGQGGVGVAINHRLAWTSIPVYVSAAWGNGGGKENVGRVGAAFEW
jgi:autotransporter adhesin